MSQQRIIATWLIINFFPRRVWIVGNGDFSSKTRSTYGDVEMIAVKTTRAPKQMLEHADQTSPRVGLSTKARSCNVCVHDSKSIFVLPFVHTGCVRLPHVCCSSFFRRRWRVKFIERRFMNGNRWINLQRGILTTVPTHTHVERSQRNNTGPISMHRKRTRFRTTEPFIIPNSCHS
jgi:hypothetical protein